MAVTVNNNAPAPMPGEMPDIMTRIQLKRCLGFADNTYYAIQKSDNPIPSHDMPGGQRFLKTEVLAWVASHPQYKLRPGPASAFKTTEAA